MRAEFRSDDLVQLPDLIVTTEDETEWRALQLFMRLMDRNQVALKFEFLPPEKDGEDPEDKGEIS